jgi:hypothetical protein
VLEFAFLSGSDGQILYPEIIEPSGAMYRHRGYTGSASPGADRDRGEGKHCIRVISYAGAG